MKWASLPTARGRKTILWIVLSMPLLWLAVLVIQELTPNSELGLNLPKRCCIIWASGH